MAESRAYDHLQEMLGHVFGDITRLEVALTHKSFLNENPGLGRSDNERLEFLGDAVLGLAIGHLLMESHPNLREGELSMTRAQIVNEQGLAEVAASVGLGEWLFLGRGEEQTGGRHKPSLLADACEAVLAAIYLDGGWDAAFAAVGRLFGARIATLAPPGQTDFKTRLQERIQARHCEAPRYVVTSQHGPDHEKTFEVAVLVQGRELARADGRSKKEAEQRAAQRALTVLDEPAEPCAKVAAPAPGEPTG